MQQACLKFNGIYKNKAKHDSVACMNNKKICIAQLLVAMNNICVDEKDATMEKALFKLYSLWHLFQNISVKSFVYCKLMHISFKAFD